MISIVLHEIVMQMVNFLILLYFVNKLIVKPLSAFIDKRAQSIKNDIDQAKENKQDAAALVEQQKEFLKEARSEAKIIRKKSEETVKIEREQLLSAAKKESAQLLVNAKKEIELAVAKAKKELVSEVGQLSVDLAESILKRKIDHRDKESIIADGLKKFAS